MGKMKETWGTKPFQSFPSKETTPSPSETQKEQEARIKSDLLNMSTDDLQELAEEGNTLVSEVLSERKELEAMSPIDRRKIVRDKNDPRNEHAAEVQRQERMKARNEDEPPYQQIGYNNDIKAA